MSEPPEVRISDADRERAVVRLQDAVTEGRLTISEFDERVAGVMRARTGCTGKQWAGAVTVRHQYRFLRWRW